MHDLEARSDTNWAVQPQKMAVGLKFRRRGIYEAKTKALISLTVNVQLICAFVFPYAKIWFSQDAAHSDPIIKKNNIPVLKVL